jgi:hypothetical protein
MVLGNLSQRSRFVTSQLKEVLDFRQTYLCDFHLRDGLIVAHCRQTYLCDFHLRDGLSVAHCCQT